MRLPFGLSPSSASALTSSLALGLLLLAGPSLAAGPGFPPGVNSEISSKTSQTTTTTTATTATTTPEATGPTNSAIIAPTATAGPSHSPAHFSFTFQQYDVNNDNEQGRIINLTSAKDHPGNSSISFVSTKVNAITEFTFTSLELCKMNTVGTYGTKLGPNQSQQSDPQMVSGEKVVMLTPQTHINSGNLSVNFKSQAVLDMLTSSPPYAYYISIDWLSSNDNTLIGRSYTPFFVFITDKVNMTAATNVLMSVTNLTSSGFGDEFPATPSNEANPQPADPLPSSTGASNTSKGKAGGLSTGAIAGIAVGGAAAVLIAMAVMVWLCLARKQGRRQRERPGGGVAGVVASRGPKVDTSHDGYDPPPGQGEYVVDKETQPRVVAGSPRSPYSDGMAGPSTRERSFTPYSDPPPASGPAPPYDDPPTPMQVTPSASPAPQHTAPVAPGRDGGAAPRAGSVTPHGLPRSVAALVEEGMTEDEIRRLEEEEHALDMAIEQAGRGGGR